jgi:hypothetical protein
VSDRLQLNLLDLVETKVETEMYPNFELGDEVEYEAITVDHQYETRKGKIAQILDTDWFRVDCLNGSQFFCSSLALKKVRVHLPVCQNLPPDDIHLKSPSIHYEIKEIKGRFYKYQRWWDGDRHKSKYIGKVYPN